MRVARARVSSFRSLRVVDIHFEEGVSVLYGANGEGKTNFLEAMYVLSNLQSFRTRRLQDLVSWGAGQTRVEAQIQGDATSTDIRLDIDFKRKRPTVDGNAPPSAAKYLSYFHTILFSSLDLELARGDQDLRRRFLDRATFVSDPSHLLRLRAYHRVLKQRNALLRSRRPGIQVWDEELVTKGLSVHEARRRTLLALQPIFEAVHKEVSGTGTPLEVSCRAPYVDDHDCADRFHSLLECAREREYSSGFTTVGPHRDAVTLSLGGIPPERFASQGQLRIVALSLKLAMLLWAQDVLGQPPVFLLDDPTSEIDAQRLTYLGQFISRWPGQVLVTATEKESIPLAHGVSSGSYLVKDGTVEAR